MDVQAFHSARLNGLGAARVWTASSIGPWTKCDEIPLHDTLAALHCGKQWLGYISERATVNSPTTPAKWPAIPAISVRACCAREWENLRAAEHHTRMMA